MPEKSCIRTLIDSQHVKSPNHCINLQGILFLICFDHLERNSSRKNCVLVVSETLRQLVNILITDDKYSLLVKASV